jgi:hypothetical protein
MWFGSSGFRVFVCLLMPDIYVSYFRDHLYITYIHVEFQIPYLNSKFSFMSNGGEINEPKHFEDFKSKKMLRLKDLRRSGILRNSLDEANKI